MFSAYFSRFTRQDRKRRIYLDYAAATPVFPEVVEAMKPFFVEQFGNPSAIHTEGRFARKALDEARQWTARTLGVRAENITFTAGGTEANNLALYGVIRAQKDAGVDFADMEVISTKIEHPSIVEVLKHLEETGVAVRWCDVDECGLIDEQHLQTLLSDKTVLFSTAYINSEIGTIQDVSRLSRLIKKYNQAHHTDIKFHLDAAQAPLWVTCEMNRLGVDVLTLDTGKCCGPKGVGMAVTQGSVSLQPIMLGGGQESGLRAGTENVAGIVGGALSLELAQQNYKTRAAIVSDLRDRFIHKLMVIDGVVLNGPNDAHRVANNVNVSLPGCDTEYAAVFLDEKGIAASTKSACSGAGSGESVVVKTVSGDTNRASATLRFTLHDGVSEVDLDRVVAVLQEFKATMAKI